ncbi:MULTISPECIES: hypothetical protein [unclassified Acinetobacter]|uniref:hypothetical protein n=1 Tax=unclassified Acinetobacter TaxID=196816 RepID=UPI0025791E41|nr:MULTISPECIES: hypothetical protein [unclassified Acinetobacter]MDM1757828.1 hypothetical protein [Acinetobacter sp. 256-1]MDM1762074.1 hypothetical protein [Acinetobacter sp. 251-1]
MKELRFKNSAKEKITVIIEPWAIELEIEPDVKVLIKDDLGEELDFEMEYFIKGVIFYCNNSQISVYGDSQKIF